MQSIFQVPNFIWVFKQRFNIVGIVNKLGGDLKVHSEKGLGTTFYVYLKIISK